MTVSIISLLLACGLCAEYELARAPSPSDTASGARSPCCNFSSDYHARARDQISMLPKGALTKPLTKQVIDVLNIIPPRWSASKPEFADFSISKRCA